MPQTCTMAADSLLSISPNDGPHPCVRVHQRIVLQLLIVELREDNKHPARSLPASPHEEGKAGAVPCKSMAWKAFAGGAVELRVTLSNLSDASSQGSSPLPGLQVDGSAREGADCHSQGRLWDGPLAPS